MKLQHRRAKQMYEPHSFLIPRRRNSLGTCRRISIHSKASRQLEYLRKSRRQSGVEVGGTGGGV